MARTNLSTTRVKPAESTLLNLRVLRRQRISPNFSRVTLGGGDIARFDHMGFDQWFRLFIPIADHTLERLPDKLDTLSYVKYLTMPKATRPIMRNYTVRAFRPGGSDGPELDVDFVLHGDPAAGPVGPAATWAQSCSAGDAVAIIDEGTAFNPDPQCSRLFLVADETGLPAVAGILGSLGDDATGTAVVETPHPDDAQPIVGPSGVELRWVVRDDPHAAPGRAAVRHALDEGVDPQMFGWAVGESHVPTTMRRHWVGQGVPKTSIMFCGYWKLPRGRRD
ncbi:siderophore-interacting protein [Nakamurella lactea]|uniref:siderophore-interacting protein n=1 Tax=Nakamurella lactea TaxID=459515 RepID=UPI000407D693|nr:siderophore-interacting protein [Nakamurella lactea]